VGKRETEGGQYLEGELGVGEEVVELRGDEGREWRTGGGGGG
jgi:hypothetical protein